MSRRRALGPVLVAAVAAVAAVSVLVLVAGAGPAPGPGRSPASPPAAAGSGEPAGGAVSPQLDPARPVVGTAWRSAPVGGAEDPGPEGFHQLAARPGVHAVRATAVAGDGHVEAWAERPGGEALSEPGWRLAVTNEFGGPLHLAVEDEVEGWLLVQLPVRPNGTRGWVRAGAFTLAAVSQRVEIRLGDRTLVAYDGDEVALEATVTVGRPSAPTPTGRWYLRDSFAWDPDSVYGPYVLALSAFSETFEVINGGEAVVAIHGTNRPDLLGQAASLGCVRLHNDAIAELAHLVAVGAPVEILP
jgi:hypothetical protein